MATCNDCVHVEACKNLYEIHGDELSSDSHACKYFKDRSRFVELPCKLSDSIYEPKRHQITEYQITRIVLTEFGLHFGIILKKGLSFRSIITPYDIGKAVFTTREEAEQALKERERK